MQRRPHTSLKRWRIAQIDWMVVYILTFFVLASTIIIRSAVEGQHSFTGIHQRHVFNYAVAFLMMMITAMINYRVWVRWAHYFYGIGVLGLLAVYFFGVIKNGARGWFTIPLVGMDLQPAELMKLFLILFLAQRLALRDGKTLVVWRDVVPLAALMVLPFMLVLIQPDLGNAIIYGVIFLGMLWVANVKFVVVLAGMIGATVIAGASFYALTTFHAPIEAFLQTHGAGHWMQRIDTFLYPDQASKHATYQITNSLRAIGSGALWGEGYMQGDSVHGGFIPYTYSDSIFVVIGEEFGFLGASLLLLLYFFLLYRLVWIAIACPERSGSYIILGVVTMLAFQIFQNIGMFLAILPLTGITLPFISYGGSSLLINLISIGLALSIHLHGKMNHRDQKATATINMP